MASPFLNSEEYDERAHRLYDDGEYELALDTLKEGLTLYPNAVDLHVGLGYTRLAREEFAWAKQSFEMALLLEPAHEDALVGLGEVLLRFGRHDDALIFFASVPREGSDALFDLLLAMGRALYRERLYGHARRYFEEALDMAPQNAEALAAHAYTLHRSGREAAARRRLRRALALDPQLHEARVYLGHLCYDRGDWRAALDCFQAVPPAEHWDPLALLRLLELKQTFEGLEAGHETLSVWEVRLEELEGEPDEIDDLLEEIAEAGAASEAGSATPDHRVRTREGRILDGSWLEIVAQLRDETGRSTESIAQFMRRHADEQRSLAGIVLPDDDPEDFLRAIARAGLLRIEY